jgi:radical SAM superfamily enzyme YgiQ (UPF0313 family)
MEKRPKRLKIFIYRPLPARQTIWANWLFKCEPLEIEYLYTVLKDCGDIHLLDGQVTPCDLPGEVEKHRPELLLITALITNVNDMLKLSAKIKKRENPPLIFVGGPHAEVMPQHFFSPHIDGVFFNNQLVAIQKVVRAIQQGLSYQHVAGAAFPDRGTFQMNQPERVDYVSYPIPERPLLQQNKGQYNLFYFDDCASIKTSFGCPEHCTFCFCRKMNLGKYARRPMAEVIREMESFPNKNIFIVDDNFLLSIKRLKAFCKAIKERGLKKQFIIYGTARFIAEHPAIMAELKEAGLRAILVGLEFIDDTALKAVHKGSQLEHNERCIEVCHELDIELIGLFMLDPDWTKQEFRQLANYVKEKRIYLATFATLTTLPGTDLWEENNLAPADIGKLWRFDFLRLHQAPKHMSQFQYYLWMAYLYLKLIFRPDGFRYFIRRAGLKTTLRMFAYGIISIFDFLLKIRLWP